MNTFSPLSLYTQFEMALVELTIIIVFFAIIELVLKGIALWKAARAEHKYWFIALLIFNTMGILPLIYIFIVYPRIRGSRRRNVL